MARSVANLVHGLHPQMPSRGVVTKTRNRMLHVAASAGNTARQRPTHNLTRDVERQRPVAQMPPTKTPMAHVPPRPSSPPERTYRVPITGKISRRARPR